MTDQDKQQFATVGELIIAGFLFWMLVLAYAIFGGDNAKNRQPDSDSDVRPGDVRGVVDNPGPETGSGTQGHGTGREATTPSDQQ